MCVLSHIQRLTADLWWVNSPAPPDQRSSSRSVKDTQQGGERGKNTDRKRLPSLPAPTLLLLPPLLQQSPTFVWRSRTGRYLMASVHNRPHAHTVFYRLTFLKRLILTSVRRYLFNEYDVICKIGVR